MEDQVPEQVSEAPEAGTEGYGDREVRTRCPRRPWVWEQQRYESLGNWDKPLPGITMEIQLEYKVETNIDRIFFQF